MTSVNKEDDQVWSSMEQKMRQSCLSYDRRNKHVGTSNKLEKRIKNIDLKTFEKTNKVCASVIYA